MLAEEEFTPGAGPRRSCSLASPRIDLASAYRRVHRVLTGRDPPEAPLRRSFIFGLDNVTEGYAFTARVLAPSIHLSNPMSVHYRMLTVVNFTPAERASMRPAEDRDRR